jgi:hypothetical protein
MVLGYSIGYVYSTTVGGWRSVYAWAMLLAVVMGVGMSYLPFSARWLALKGRIVEARKSLMFVLPHLSDNEIENLNDIAIRASAYTQSISIFSDFRKLTSGSIYPAMV